MNKMECIQVTLNLMILMNSIAILMMEWDIRSMRRKAEDEDV